jgi:hypothetical protein
MSGIQHGNNGELSKAAYAAAPVVDQLEVYVTDPAEAGAQLVTISGVPIDRLRTWKCPCCGDVKAVFAQDDLGRVWLAPTASTGEQGHVLRMDAREDIADILRKFPVVLDRPLIASWYMTGLYDELVRMFAS